MTTLLTSAPRRKPRLVVLNTQTHELKVYHGRRHIGTYMAVPGLLSAEDIEHVRVNTRVLPPAA